MKTKAATSRRTPRIMVRFTHPKRFSGAGSAAVRLEVSANMPEFLVESQLSDSRKVCICLI